jgi:hypothetical protein
MAKLARSALNIPFAVQWPDDATTAHEGRKMASLGLLISLFVAADTDDARVSLPVFLARVEATDWPTAAKDPPERIVRNDDGQIVMLRLDGIRLLPGDIELIRQLVDVENLGFNSSSITDSDLKKLAGLPKLKGIALNRTAITDDGVATLTSFPKLRTVCLGGVKVSRPAVEALKAKKKGILIGYSPSRN